MAVSGGGATGSGSPPVPPGPGPIRASVLSLPQSLTGLPSGVRISGIASTRLPYGSVRVATDQGQIVLRPARPITPGSSVSILLAPGGSTATLTPAPSISALSTSAATSQPAASQSTSAGTTATDTSSSKSSPALSSAPSGSTFTVSRATLEASLSVGSVPPRIPPIKTGNAGSVPGSVSDSVASSLLVLKSGYPSIPGSGLIRTDRATGDAARLLSNAREGAGSAGSSGHPTDGSRRAMRFFEPPLSRPAAAHLQSLHIQTPAGTRAAILQSTLQGSAGADGLPRLGSPAMAIALALLYLEASRRSGARNGAGRCPQPDRNAHGAPSSAPSSDGEVPRTSGPISSAPPQRHSGQLLLPTPTGYRTALFADLLSLEAPDTPPSASGAYGGGSDGSEKASAEAPPRWTFQPTALFGSSGCDGSPALVGHAEADDGSSYFVFLGDLPLAGDHPARRSLQIIGRYLHPRLSLHVVLDPALSTEQEKGARLRVLDAARGVGLEAAIRFAASPLASASLDPMHFSGVGEVDDDRGSLCDGAGDQRNGGPADATDRPVSHS